jgi:hypothetical protein
MIGKLISGVVGIFGATILFWAGIAFEHRPAGFLSFHVWGPIGFTDPGGPAAQLAALELKERQAGQRAVGVQRAQASISAAAGVAEQAAQVRIRTVYRTLTQEVPGVLTPEIDRVFDLPVGLLRVHDAAARGVDLSDVPDPAGRPDDAAAGVAVSAVGQALVANYGACHADQERLAALQAWLKDVAAAQAATPP